MLTCTSLRIRLERSSLSRIAKATEKGNISTYFIKLMRRVLPRMVKNPLEEKMISNHFIPAHVHSERAL